LSVCYSASKKLYNTGNVILVGRYNGWECYNNQDYYNNHVNISLGYFRSLGRVILGHADLGLKTCRAAFCAACSSRYSKYSKYSENTEKVVFVNVDTNLIFNCEKCVVHYLYLYGYNLYNVKGVINAISCELRGLRGTRGTRGLRQGIDFDFGCVRAGPNPGPGPRPGPGPQGYLGGLRQDDKCDKCEVRHAKAGKLSLLYNDHFNCVFGPIRAILGIFKICSICSVFRLFVNYAPSSVPSGVLVLMLMLMLMLMTRGTISTILEII
jgi:hypothetical protein